MNRLFTVVLTLCGLTLPIGLASCSVDEPIQGTEQSVPPVDTGNDSNDNTPMNNNLKITIGSTIFNVTLHDNATATAFKALLPMTVNMSEMNRNEKYYYLSGDLPTVAANPGTIQVGDLMLYGASCLVLFYETFRTSYSYTSLGRVDNPLGLTAALGTGNVTVTFELQ